MRCVLATVVLILACGEVVAAEPDQKERVKKSAQAIGEATRKGDAAAIVDLTYGPVVEEAGGREKMIAAVGPGLTMFEVLDFTVGEPGDFHTAGKQTFVVVPISVSVQVETLKVKGNSYLFGISADAGATWKFVDGQGLSDEAERKKLFPELPAGLKLPPLEEPMIIQ